MKTIVRTFASMGAAMLMAASVGAQSSSSLPSSQAGDLRATAASRFQLAQMERVLSGAAEHGAAIARERLREALPADVLLTDSVRVRGFAIDGYGWFFDVEMPPLEGTLAWIYQTFDQNNLELDSAIRAVRSYLDRSGDDDVRQAFARVQLQLNASPLAGTDAGDIGSPAASDTVTRSAGGRVGSGSAPPSPTRTATALSLPQSDVPAAARTTQPINPSEAYRAEVREALIEAILDHATALRLAPADTLMVAARGTSETVRVGTDRDSPTVHISIRGSDLDAFRAGRLTRDEARSRVVVRVF